MATAGIYGFYGSFKLGSDFSQMSLYSKAPAVSSPCGSNANDWGTWTSDGERLPSPNWTGTRDDVALSLPPPDCPSEPKRMSPSFGRLTLPSSTAVQSWQDALGAQDGMTSPRATATGAYPPVPGFLSPLHAGQPAGTHSRVQRAPPLANRQSSRRSISARGEITANLKG